ncbi:MAG: Rpn family recombination-promoting nuclease/putative transposase, partial [Syntrophorhabdaceae bacterium]|nr:Rpn family recombination-promoting nuclease/putative transposase [Syntrophorhabdaceae bacterium]
DFVFRLIFGDQRNVDILSAFLRSVLDIPNDEYDHLTIVDPYLKGTSKNLHFLMVRRSEGTWL